MNHTEAQRKIQAFLLKEFKRPEFLFLGDIFDLLNKVEVFLVGGAIRDILLEREVTDFDFVIRNIDTETLEDFLVQYGEISYVGKQFGVYKLRPYNTEIEIDIAFPRRELSKGPGYKDFEIISDTLASIQEDLIRRDFTVNAFAYSIKEKKLIDEVQGLNDIKRGVIRTVGDPRKRFSEDYTRILRSVRQSIQLDFSIQKETKKAIIDEMQGFNGGFDEYVSKEMVAHEFIKAFSVDSLQTILLYDELLLLKHVLPEVARCKGVFQNEDFHPEGDVFEHIKAILSKLTYSDSLRLKYAALFHDIGKPQTAHVRVIKGEKRNTFYGHQDKGVQIFEKWASKMLIPHDLQNDVSFLIKNHLYLWHGDIHEMSISKITRIFLENYGLGKDLLRLHAIDISFEGKRRAESETYIESAGVYVKMLHDEIISGSNRIDVPIDGNDIMKYFPEKEGAEIGKLLKEGREYYLDTIRRKKKLSKLELISYLKNKHE